RRYDLQLPGRVSASGGGRRVELVERLPVDGRRAVALIRRDGVEHLILIGPEGHAMIETGITAPPRAEKRAEAKPAKLAEDISALRGSFAALVERYRPAQPTPEVPPAPKTRRKPTAPRKRAMAAAKPEAAAPETAQERKETADA
ncbi:MAG: flagellar biosynthetic protein FliO, partial [Sphingomonas bacterium]